MKLYIFFSFLAVTTVSGQQRIAGGDAATIEEFPFAASLLTNSGSGSYRHACGGTIISASAILTAASCFFSGGDVQPALWWRARVGTSFTNTGGTTYIISQITPHPDFVVESYDNNLAVVRTRSDMAFGSAVQAARIPGAAYTFVNNQPIVAIGWGANSPSDSSISTQLQQAQIWTIDQNNCAGRYSALNVSLTNNMICVGWWDVGVRGQCEGDVGSPIVDNGVVVGVHSHGVGCGDLFYPNINIRLNGYTRWIVNTALGI